MSAPLNLTSEELRDLARAVDGLTALRIDTGVNFDPYSELTLGIGDNHGVRVRWDADREQYVIDDQVGS